MVSPINNALSGMAAAARRLEVSANNIANQFTTQTVKDGVKTNETYTPQDVIQLSQEGGGVITQLQDSQDPYTQVLDPTNPLADENGFVKSPNVSLEKEIANQMVASYDYKANLNVIKVQDNIMKNLLDIFG